MATPDFSKLLEQLELQEWPAVYFFKFIVPNDNKKIAQLTELFDDGGGLRFHESRGGKYISIGSKELMMSASDVIEKYKEAAKIEGLIAL